MVRYVQCIIWILKACRVEYIGKYMYEATSATQVINLLELSDSNDSVTIITVSVTITIVIAKNYYHDSGHVVTGMWI